MPRSSRSLSLRWSTKARRSMPASRWWTPRKPPAFITHRRKRRRSAASCGRFLCALCDLELNGQHLCPSCLASGKKKGKIRNLENERTCHDGIALTLSLLPLLMWPITAVTAPCAVYYSIRHWKSPTSILPRTKIRFIFALIFAGIQCALWIYFLGFLLYARK
ncbi:MAG: hypothetical protein QM796_17720 [Chthoniobacteraceae bacterium]